MQCRDNCNACCIAPSINHPLPGMPKGKPAGVSCVNLDLDSRRCKIWGTPSYPHTCKQFTASKENCGDSKEQAFYIIEQLELATRPD